MNKGQAMYPKQDPTTKQWYVCRVERDGYISVTPWTVATKAAALDYIRAHGLKPCKPLA